MSSDTVVRSTSPETPTFYTVAETAELLRVDSATLYRAIREGAFPAIRVRSRYVVPAAAVQDMVERALDTHSCVDVAVVVAERRLEREVERISRLKP